MSAGTTEHPDAIELIHLARGTLPAERAAELREHCLECGPCGDQLAVVVLLRRGSGGRNRRATRRWQVAAAAILLVGLGLVALFASLETGSTKAPRISREREVVDEYAALASDANLLHPAVVDLYERQYGEPVSERSPERRLVQGLELLVQDRPAAAVEVLQEVWRARPNDPAVAGYLGIARYLDGDVSPATERLLVAATERAQRGMAFYFRWYTANLYLRRGNVAAAEILLDDDTLLAVQPTAGPARELLGKIRKLREAGAEG